MAAWWHVATPHFPSDYWDVSSSYTPRSVPRHWKISVRRRVDKVSFRTSWSSLCPPQSFGFYPLTVSLSSCRPGFRMEFLAEVWESMNSTFSLFQQGGVWTAVCGADLHSCILFSTWEENVHHQIACLWDIKERRCGCVCGVRNTGGFNLHFSISHDGESRLEENLDVLLIAAKCVPKVTKTMILMLQNTHHKTL